MLSDTGTRCPGAELPLENKITCSMLGGKLDSNLTRRIYRPAHKLVYRPYRSVMQRALDAFYRAISSVARVSLFIAARGGLQFCRPQSCDAWCSAPLSLPFCRNHHHLPHGHSSFPSDAGAVRRLRPLSLATPAHCSRCYHATQRTVMPQ